ncbi:MAG: putative transport system permease protein [Actinomycetota bacterium]
MLVVLMRFVIVALLLVSVVSAITNPTIRRLAFRNLTRRRGEAVLVVLGSLLGTAIITAALIVGDTLGSSVRDSARTELGPIDETVRVVGLGTNDAVYQQLHDRPLANSDGLLRMTSANVSLATPGDDPRAVPWASLNEVDFAEARAFGGDESATGMKAAGATPSGNEAVLNKRLAKKLGLNVGDRFHVFGFGHQRDLVVRAIIATKGLAGYGGRVLYAPPGTIASLVAPRGAAPRPVEAAGAPPESLVLVSNTGGVFDGAKFSPGVEKELSARVKDLTGVEVLETKADRLEFADDVSAQFKQIFGGIGAFSVIAGILLLVQIFVMLADERKSENGMLRAIGLKRNHLVRAFGMEGVVYAMVSAGLGVLVGIGVGRMVATFAANVFNRGGSDGGFGLSFSLKSSSLTLGFMIGACIALVTVWGTSIAQGRLNVIRAIRDLPAGASVSKRGLVRVILRALSVAVGVLLFRNGIKNEEWFGTLAGIPIAAWCAIPLLQLFLSRRLAVLIGCGTALVWGIVVFTLFPDALTNTEFAAFVVQGVILVGSAVAIVATNDDIAIWGVSKLGVSRRTLAARLGFAYPLAKVFRTSMLMGMYAIVVFTLTFLSVFANLFGAQAPQFARDTAAGYDILVDSNFSNPVPAPSLLHSVGVASVATLDQAYPEWTTKDVTEPERWGVSGYDDALLARGVPVLNKRLPRFGSDRAAWEAVMHDPKLAIVPSFFLQDNGPPTGGIELGDKITGYDTVSGRTTVLTVAGIVESDFVRNGPMVGKTFLRSFVTDLTPSRHYVAVAAGADPRLVADRLQGQLINFGVDAATFQDEIADQLSQQDGFLSLMQGYLGLGLVIGIAGLGVVMVRAVRERRRQIGMLRAMGFPSRTIRQMFLTEASFLAVQGILLGTVLALVTSYNMLTYSDTFGGESIQFEIPFKNIILVSTIALVASLAASAFPANQASKIRPAVALRIAD